MRSYRMPFADNPGAIPALAFIALLMVAAVYLAAGDRAWANKLAEIAYYMLVLSVATEIAVLAVESRISRKMEVKMCIGHLVCLLLLFLSPQKEVRQENY